MSKMQDTIKKERSEVLSLSINDFKKEIVEWLKDLYYASDSSAHQYDYIEQVRLAACIERISGEVVKNS